MFRFRELERTDKTLCGDWIIGIEQHYGIAILLGDKFETRADGCPFADWSREGCSHNRSYSRDRRESWRPALRY
jgi:hypothetical protein